MSSANPTPGYYNAVSSQPNVYYPGPGKQKNDVPAKRSPAVNYQGYSVAKTFGPTPTEFQCPFCHVQVTSYIQHTNGVLVWILVALSFLLFCWICFFIPFLMTCIKDVEHYCPYCNNRVGIYRRAST